MSSEHTKNFCRRGGVNAVLMAAALIVAALLVSISKKHQQYRSRGIAAEPLKSQQEKVPAVAPAHGNSMLQPSFTKGTSSLRNLGETTSRAEVAPTSEPRDRRFPDFGSRPTRSPKTPRPTKTDRPTRSPAMNLVDRLEPPPIAADGVGSGNFIDRLQSSRPTRSPRTPRPTKTDRPTRSPAMNLVDRLEPPPFVAEGVGSGNFIDRVQSSRPTRSPRTPRPTRPPRTPRPTKTDRPTRAPTVKFLTRFETTRPTTEARADLGRFVEKMRNRPDGSDLVNKATPDGV